MKRHIVSAALVYVVILSSIGEYSYYVHFRCVDLTSSYSFFQRVRKKAYTMPFSLGSSYPIFSLPRPVRVSPEAVHNDRSGNDRRGPVESDFAGVARQRPAGPIVWAHRVTCQQHQLSVGEESWGARAAGLSPRSRECVDQSLNCTTLPCHTTYVIRVQVHCKYTC